MEPQAAVSLENGPFKYRPWEIVVDLFFSITMPATSIEVSQKLSRERKRKQIVPPSRHFHGLYSYRLELSTNHCMRNPSVIIKIFFELGVLSLSICRGNLLWDKLFLTQVNSVTGRLVFAFFPRLPFRSYSFRLQNETSASHLYTSFFQPWQEKVWYTCVYLRRRSLSFWWSVGSMSRRRNDRKS